MTKTFQIAALTLASAFLSLPLASPGLAQSINNWLIGGDAFDPLPWLEPINRDLFDVEILPETGGATRSGLLTVAHLRDCRMARSNL